MPPTILVVRSSLLALWIAALPALPAQDRATKVYPGKDWAKIASPAEAGWSAKELATAKTYAKTIAAEAVVIVHRGRVVCEWGPVERPFMCHSMRKSILAVLYGIQVEKGKIDLDRTMLRLGIDDNAPSLTDVEKTARVRDILKARSGVYHPALYETRAMAARRPKRGSHEPDSFWYYNNWDFNVAGTIFENLTGRSLFEEFEDRLAGPLGMQDFVREKHTSYYTGRDSVHPAYPFRLSARDLARFGLLCARNGKWRDRQIVPARWVAEMTKPYSDAGKAGGYGYMWWVASAGRHFPGATIPDGSYTARGAGGHYVLVVPQWDLVVVHRVNTFRRGRRVTATQFGGLLKHIVAACPKKILQQEAKTKEVVR